MLGCARAQIWPYAPEYRRPRHFHAEHELNLIVAGKARFGIGNLVVNAGPGEILSFQPGQDHVLMAGSPDLVLFAIGMEPMMAADVMNSRGHRVWLPTSSRPNPREWELLIKKASALAGSESTGLGAELWERVHDLSESFARVTHGVHVLTRRTLETMGAAPDLSRTELARFVKGNASEVSRCFHRDVGVTLVEYRTRLRLIRFIRLASGRGSNLTAAALNSGFGSYSQCHRSFQAEFACAPREFFSGGLRECMEHEFEPFAS